MRNPGTVRLVSGASDSPSPARGIVLAKGDPSGAREGSKVGRTISVHLQYRARPYTGSNPTLVLGACVLIRANVQSG